MDKRNNRLYLTCPPRHVNTILEEFTDRFAAEHNGSILLYGTTTKARDGFLLMNWTTPIPPNLIAQMQTDEDILDFLIYVAPEPSNP